MKKTLVILSLLAACPYLSAAEWQWSVEVKSIRPDETNAPPRAFLWIPPGCKQLRGLVLGMHNMCEELIFEHPDFRQTMSDIGFAAVWISPIISHQWSEGCQQQLDQALNDLAELSGYSELKQAPVVPLGHSAMATFPWSYAAWNPQRTLAIISYKGDAPRTNLTGYGGANLEWGRTRNVDGIPGLMVEGEYEWWEARVNPALAFRMMYPASCISFLCDAGQGHFDVSDKVVSYISLFIRKAAQYRLSDTSAELMPLLKPDKGWLAERWNPAQGKREPPAPFAEYKGNRHDAFWYFDEEMATATERHYAFSYGKKEQHIGFIQNNKLLPFDEKLHARINGQFEPETDGLTFHLSAAFTDTLRSKIVSEHSHHGKITIDRICGPVEKLNDTTFSLRFYRMGFSNKKQVGDIWLLAHHDGDEAYKSSVQQINIHIPYPNTKGKEQHISFPALKNVEKGIKSIPLGATSDSRLPVYYYIKEGPAEILGNQAVITPIPARAKYPVKVTVVAWQYGRSSEPAIQTAEPVERSFWISAHTILEETRTTLASPDGKQVFELYQKQNPDSTLAMYYSIRYNGQPVVLESKLDIQLDNHIWERALAKVWAQPDSWNDVMVLDKVERSSANETWTPLYGERSTIRNNYNTATFFFSRGDKSGYRMNLEVRSYNEGVAFRYHFPMHPEAIYHKVTAENTEFTMPEGTTAWWTQWAQAPYSAKPLNDWADNSERPLTMKINDHLYACIAEAAQIDFPKADFRLSETKPNTIQLSLYGEADMVTPFATPWRVIMVSDRLGGLLENSYMLLNLNEANKIAHTGWIKPGKIMRETTLTTANAKACIDFCAKHGMQYILFDWKWYGPAFDFRSDAGKVAVSELNMPEVVAYGKSQGIGVWVYVNQHALQHQADRIFPIYKEWGLAGIKFGFVQFKTQGWATWLHDLVRKAATNNLMVNIHDEYRPTGYSRTYPNLLTQEGIRGNEEFPDATHNTILPFTRMVAGAADYTVCYFDPRLKNTHAHQLALPIIFYSPLQTLYWYDTPARIEDVPELEFFDNVPVSWDETKVIHDRIGEYVTIARRSGTDWFVGTIGNNDARKIDIPLSFLDVGQKYIAHIYQTDDKIPTSTKVRITRAIVDSQSLLHFSLKEKDGCAIRLVPAGEGELGGR
jgi:alpha-glucosidase